MNEFKVLHSFEHPEISLEEQEDELTLKITLKAGGTEVFIYVENVLDAQIAGIYYLIGILNSKIMEN